MAKVWSNGKLELKFPTYMLNNIHCLNLFIALRLCLLQGILVINELQCMLVRNQEINIIDLHGIC